MLGHWHTGYTKPPFKEAPVVAAVAGAVASNAVGTYLTTTVGGFWAGTIAGISYGAVAGAVAGAVVSGVVGQALADEPEQPDFGSNSVVKGLLLNKQANDAAIPVIYGSRRIGGTRVLLETTGTDNEYLHIVLAFSEGEIDSIENIYLNNVVSTDSRFTGFLDTYTHTGADDQSADSNLVSNVTDWTTDHRLRGTGYLYARLKYDQDAYPSGVPTITVDVKGQKVYDPRDSSTAWSENPALCIRDYLTNTRYGRGIDSSLIDDTTFNSAANYCEEDVTIGGATKDRYTCNGVVNTQNGSMEVLKKMLTACRGFLIFSGGKYKLIIDKTETASFTFSKDNIVGGWTIALGSKNTQFNRIRANFFNPSRDWQPDIAVIDSSTLRTQDNGLLLEKTIDLPFTNDIDRAKMITTINLNQSRQQITCEFTATIEGLRAEVGDVVYVKHATPGWDTLNSNQGKLFRVIGIKLKNTDEVSVSCLEYDATAYDFGTISASDSAPNTNLPDMTTAVAPTGLAIAESLYTTTNGSGVKVKGTVSWTASADVFVKEYIVEYKLNADSTWIFETTTRRTTADILDLAPGDYDVRVKAVNTVGVSSSYTTITSQTIQGLTANPADITGLSVVALNDQAHISWDLASDLDVKHGGKIRFRHSNVTDGTATWASSTDIGSAVAGHNTDTVLPLLAGTYMARAVDSTGNESLTEASHVITTVPNITKMNRILTVTENPSFTGTKTGLDTVDNILKFESTDLIDDRTANIDTWTFFDSNTGVDTTGVYEFDGADLGSILTSRVTHAISFTTFEVGDYIDSRTSLIDTWTDFDNPPADLNLDLYVSTTNDAVAGSPTWSAWSKFKTGDFTCRGYKFKLTASSADSDHQFNLSELSVDIDMPDRVQGAKDITSGAGVKSIVYSDSFYDSNPSVGITANDMASGDYFTIANKSATGFDVTFYNSSDTAVSKSFNWQARGY